MKKRWMLAALALAYMLTVTACAKENAGEAGTTSAGLQDEASVRGESEKAVYQKITADEAKEMMTEDAVILDVRSEEEFASGHIPNAVLLPHTEIADQAEELLADREQTILIYCRSGNRSKTAANELIDMGYTKVYDFGGVNTWTGELVTDEDADK